MLMEKYHITITLDKRRKKANKKYPVRLRVFTPVPRKQKLYWTEFDYTETEFQNIWLTFKPRKEFKESREQLEAIEFEAKEIARGIEPFDFDEFEKKLLRKGGDGILLKYHYKIRLKELEKNEQLSTKSTYELAEKSIQNFLEHKSNKKYNDLSFYNINSKWLKEYEHYMLETLERSVTTVSMYLRTLKAIFNKAIDEKEIDKDIYPFGEKKYQIPTAKNVKKALNKNKLKELFHAKAKTPDQQKAKDFWFFSYACNGMNIKDIALLKYKNITNNEINFYRAKTKTTSKSKTKIIVYLSEFAISVIEKYGTQQQMKNQYIFEIINDNMNAEEVRRAIHNFTRYINQHMKKLCEANELPWKISTYTARHSFASNYIEKGASVVDAMESLGHNSISTTQNYLKSLESESKEEISRSLMDFD
jgi:integrase